MAGVKASFLGGAAREGQARPGSGQGLATTRAGGWRARGTRWSPMEQFSAPGLWRGLPAPAPAVGRAARSMALGVPREEPGRRTARRRARPGPPRDAPLRRRGRPAPRIGRSASPAPGTPPAPRSCPNRSAPRGPDGSRPRERRALRRGGGEGHRGFHDVRNITGSFSQGNNIQRPANVIRSYCEAC